MYESFYGLREKPFNIAPDPAFLYQSSVHREALASLRYGIKEGKGFIVLTGEVGTGKTLILHALLNELEDTVKSAYIFYPKITFKDLLRLIANELECPLRADTGSDSEMLIQLNNFLIERFRNNQATALIIDEAQDLNNDMLENIRLLSNLETSKSKLLTIILVGQPELHEKLESPDLRQLRQRIVVRYHMTPLDKSEVKNYIRHRLRSAGALDPDIFNDKAIARIANYTDGVPRLINIVCDNALLLGYAEEESTIGVSLIDEVIRDLQGGALATAPTRMARKARAQSQTPRRWQPIAAIAGAIVLGAVAAVFATTAFLSRPPSGPGPGVISAPITPVAEAAPENSNVAAGVIAATDAEALPVAPDLGANVKTVAASGTIPAPSATTTELPTPAPTEVAPAEPTLAPPTRVPTATPIPPKPTQMPTLTPTPSLRPTRTPTPRRSATSTTSPTAAATLAEGLRSPTQAMPTFTPQIPTPMAEGLAEVRILPKTSAAAGAPHEIAVQIASFLDRDRGRDRARLSLDIVKRLDGQGIMAHSTEDVGGVPWIRVFAVNFTSEAEAQTFLDKAKQIPSVREGNPFICYISRPGPGGG